MKLISKGLLILTLFLVSILFVSAVEPIDCNNVGGIWCGSINSGKCIYATTIPQSSSELINCLVSVNQTINTLDYANNFYQFKNLIIEESVILKFYYKSKNITPSQYLDPRINLPSPSDILGVNEPLLGGNFGSGGRGKPINGGNGGIGGNTSDFGRAGQYAFPFWDGGSNNCGGWGGFPQVKVGANIQIISEQITLSGTIDLSGWDGNPGMNAACHNSLGYGGGGGSGGSGAGTIKIYSNNISGSGKMILIGGKGGSGGNSNNNDGEQCKDYSTSTNPGGGGGGGGGGAGGKVLISTTLPSSMLSNIFCYGGEGGIGGCIGWAEEGKNGFQGEKTSNGIGSDCVVLFSTDLEPETKCNDYFDNDMNGLTDMKDPNCQSQDYCPSFESNALINGSANDGSDGCCGDDLPGCYPTLGFYYPQYTCSYTNQDSCESNSFCKWVDDHCTLKSHEEYCLQFSENNCPSLVCESRLGDYGYVTPDKKYFCYNASDFLIPGSSEYKWSNAYENVFNASRIFISNKEADFISNTVNWFYCNASNTNLLGLPVKEYSSFPSEINLNEQMQCFEFMNLLGNEFSGVCTLSNFINCCNNQVIYLSDPSSIENCVCYDNSGNEFNVCNSDMASLFSFCDVQGGNFIFGEYVEKDLCMFDFVNCINRTYYDPDATCQNQNPSGKLCDKNTQICVNGVIINAKNNPSDKFCCYDINNNARCEYKNTADCTSLGGTIFNPVSEECYPGHSYFNTPNEGYCCLGPVRQKTYDLIALFSQVNNDSYICYNENNNSYFGHCCYDEKCMYSDILSIGTLSLGNFKGRLFYSGSSLHTVSSYDKYVPSRGVVVDYVFKYTTQGNNPIPITIENNINFSTFKYLEFSIAYSNKNVIGNIIINGINYGPLLNYIIGSDESMRWHRVKIPINNINKNEQISSISINKKAPIELTVLVDNIILIPEDTSSENYYCSAGFGKWIADLDTNLTTHPFGDEFYTNEEAWKNKGSYEHACNSVGGYYWTGHQCCGDDTAKENYGEFYNDTQSGCFNGSIIFDKKTVSYTYNIDENSEDFESFIYKDLIYNDTHFLACQANTTNKYSNIKISYDGTLNVYQGTEQLSDLITKNVDNSCIMVGNYYCYNNAWRQKIIGIGVLGIDYNGSLSLKSVPPATNLIKNSNFGGECPESICQQST